MLYVEYIFEGDNKVMGLNERNIYFFDGIYYLKFENKMYDMIDNVIVNLYYDF